MPINQIKKQEIEEIMRMPGEVRGAVFQTTASYIKEKKGEEGIKALEREMENLGHPLNFSKIRAMDWYPTGLRVLSFIAVKRAFNWGDKELIEMGNNAPKYSFIVKLLLKYFLSFRKIFEESPKYWDEHYSVGKLEAHEFNEDKKYCVIRIHNFRGHPLFCIFWLGYFKRIAQFGGRKNVKIKETKCVFRGDPYHEYLIKWE